METENPAGLREFRELVLSRRVRFWDDAKDIKVAAHETLSHFARREDLVGWVRPPAVPTDVGPLADEIARLSRENASLRERLAVQEGPLIAGFRFEELRELLQRKGVLDLLRERRESLESEQALTLKGPNSPEESMEFESLKSRVRTLERLGLIREEFVTLSYTSYSLTEAGRMFLNRLELQDLREKT